MMSKADISIALCTYNGEKFLEEQLQSLAVQTVLPAELVVCDDGSKDRTYEILQEYSEKLPFTVKIYVNTNSCGVVKNFSRCMGLCQQNYIALSDQDDIWEPNKLELLWKKMKQLEGNASAVMPLLVYSDLQVVNEVGRCIQPSFLGMQNLQAIEEEALSKLLVQNFVTGCTCLINKPLMRLSVPIPAQVIMHDWWIALIAAAIGRIGFVPVCTVKYRQHGRNTIGAKGYFSHANMKKAMNFAALNKQVALAAYQAVLLKERLERQQCPIPEVLLRYIPAMQEGGIAGIITLLKNGVHKQGILRNIILAGIVAMGYYKYELQTLVKSKNRK